MNERLTEAFETIDFVSRKIAFIREKNKDADSMDIKCISDLQRYSEVLNSLSSHVIHLKTLGLTTFFPKDNGN